MSRVVEQRNLTTARIAAWPGRGTLVRAVMALVVALAAAGLVAAPARAATTTVVSLTFDDGQVSQFNAASLMNARGMDGTFYVNSGLVHDAPGYYMSWGQLQELRNAGHEIGGHTLNHTNLTTVSLSTATQEVCQDRTNLIDRGFGPVTSFAYPEAAVNSTARSAVSSCYTAPVDSARDVGNLCSGCGAVAETIPPADRFRVRTPQDATTSTTLANLQSYVTAAENSGGGWVPLVFHGICDDQCAGTYSLTTATFTAFLDWLASRGANGTVVRTVGAAMSGGGGGTTPPPPPPSATPSTSIACNDTACTSGWYRSPVTVTLTATNATATHYTTDGSDPTVNSPRYTGPFQVQQTTTVKYLSTGSGGTEADKTQVVQVDAAAPTVALTVNPATVARRGTVVLTATVQDPGTGSGAPSGMANVIFHDGSSALATVAAPTNGTYTFTWNLRPNVNGQRTLTAVATDSAGNAARSAPVVLTVR